MHCCNSSLCNTSAGRCAVFQETERSRQGRRAGSYRNHYYRHSLHYHDSSECSFCKLSSVSLGCVGGNPGSKYFTLEFVEAKGSKGSNRVDIYVKVKAVSLSIQNALVGGAGLTKAYDADGNEYGAGCDYDDMKNLNPDVAVKLKFATICEVPSTVTSFVLVKGPWNLNGGRHSSSINEYIQLKNVPIVWE